MTKYLSIKKISYIFLITGLLISSAKAAEECFENTSRAVFNFNMAFDDAIVEPIAKGFNKLPDPIKTGTSNFTSNIGTLLSIPNNILQGNFKQLGHSIGSFAVNTSVGILGLLNPAEKLSVIIDQYDKQGKILFASQDGIRSDLTSMNLMNSYLKHPLMTFKIISAIHFEAFKLWIKGIKLVKKKLKIKNNITFES